MKTEQINIRLRPDLAAALDRVAREEALDRGTAIRRLLETSIRRWELERALQGYQRGELSLGRAAEESGLTQWELIDAARAAGIAYPLDAQDVERRLHHVSGRVRPEVSRTLPDIPPDPAGFFSWASTPLRRASPQAITTRAGSDNASGGGSNASAC
jgi:predicted HTH domain antitoxin